jgi:WD40 repeat protein
VSSSKSGKYVAVGGEEGRVALFELEGSNYKYYRNIPGNISSITGIVFSNDDSQETIITSAFDHSIHVNRFSDSKNEGLILKENPLWVRGLALSYDNKNIIATGQGGFITVWPSDIENLVARLNNVGDIQKMLNTDVDTEKIKDEIGDDLYKSIEVVDDKNKGMNKFWQFLTKEYLKN